MWEDRTIPFDCYEWPPEAFLKSLNNRELGRDEFWRRAAHAAISMRDNDAFLAALNEVKCKRFGSGFPSLEATTPQNEPFVLPERIKSSGGRGSKSSSQRKKTKENVSVKPKTLLYYQHGNNGVLMKQRQRVDIVFRLWESWGWISDTETEDFDRFWEGAPRHCNITWTANSTILTNLLQKLIKQPYMGGQTGLAARSMVEQQFGMTSNYDSRNRITDDDEDKIQLTLLVLDIKNPLPKRRAGNDDEENDMSEAALREIFAGQLRSTKTV